LPRAAPIAFLAGCKPFVLSGSTEDAPVCNLAQGERPGTCKVVATRDVGMAGLYRSKVRKVQSNKITNA
jgi:hypothetical protein